MSAANESARDLLKLADRERRVAEGVESIGRAFRLGEAIAVKRGLFGWRSAATGIDVFRALTSAESLALYRAAQIVRREALTEAEALEARVTTATGDKP